MGVSGLTTFLEQYTQTKYASSISLTDCTVIVDGFNAAFFLYHQKKEPNAHRVGGDYIGFAKDVREFFQHMKNANIFPIVVFDGAHEGVKFSTIDERFRKCIADNVKPSASQPTNGYIPVGLKTAFIEILKEQKIFHIQTLYEADDTIAYLSEQLKAPVISSDSDFQVYLGVDIAIPFNKIQFKRKTRASKDKKKVFTLHAKVVMLKTVCKQAFKYDEPHMRLVPLIALVLGNDKFYSSAFKGVYSSGAADTKFKLILEWIRQLPINPTSLQMQLVKLAAGSESEDTQEEGPAEQLKRILLQYSGQNRDDSVWDMVRFHCSHLNVQVITFKTNNKPLVTTTNQPRFDTNTNTNGIDCSETNLLVESDNRVRLSKSHADGAAPEWFMASIRNCELSTEVLDLLVNQMIWLWPQAETTSHIPSQAIALPILKVIAGLLGCCGEIEVITRSGSETFVEKATIETESHVTNIFTTDIRKGGRMIFLSSLGCVDFQAFIGDWPAYARFTIITLLYFLQQRPNCSAIAMGVLLSILKSNIESNNDQRDSSSTNESASSIIKNQKMTKKMKSFYNMVEKRDRLGNYNISRVYHYCEYKSIFAHAKTLNVLLGNPFKVPKITKLDSYIVYNVHEMTASKFSGNSFKFLDKWLCTDPLGTVLRLFLKFAEQPTVDTIVLVRKNSAIQAIQSGDGDLVDKFKELNLYR